MAEAEPLSAEIEEIKALPDRSLACAELLRLLRRSADDPSAMGALALSSHPFLPLLLADVHIPDEETSALALKCLGFMLYHPALVATISVEMARSVLDSLVKLITTTSMKAVCNLAMWCVSVQQLDALVIESEASLLIKAIVHALDNPFGSLSTTFEAAQASMKLASQIPEKMRDLSSIWLPPIYRRLLSTDNTERSTVERCLLKMLSVILPPQSLLSEAVTLNLKQELLPLMADMLHDNLQKVQVIKAWGWYVSLLGSAGLSDRHLLNKLLKIPEKTFTYPDPQVQIASLVAWRHLIDALLPPYTKVIESKIASKVYTVASFTAFTGNSDHHLNGLLKKIKMIMVPLIGILSSKCGIAVRSSCLSTWHYLLHKLDTLVNHLSILQTVFGPILEATFSSGLDNQNMCLWNLCIDLLHGFALSKDKEIALHEEQSCYDKASWKDHPIKWLPWDINYLDFHLKMIGTIVGPGEMKCMNSETRVMAMNAALKIFKSVLKGVQIELKKSSTCNDRIQNCITKILKFVKEVSEGLVSEQNVNLQFVAAIVEEIDPSILKSPFYEVNLDIKYISDLQCPENISNSNISALQVKALGCVDMVSPMVYTTILSLSTVAQSILKLPPEDAVLYAKQQTNLPFFSANALDNLHMIVSFMYMHIRKPVDCRLNFLMMWNIIAKGLKEKIGCVSKLDSPTVDCNAVYQFLCLPLLLFLSLVKKSATSESGNSSEFCVSSSSPHESELELVIEVYTSLHDYSIHVSETITSSRNDFSEGLCELFVRVLDENMGLFVYNIECCLQKKDPNIAIISVLGEATIQIFKNTKVFGYAPLQSKESYKDCRQCTPIKNSLGFVSRFLRLSLVAFKARSQDEHHLTNRVFEALDSFVGHFFLKQDILLLLEMISDPLCQWLSSCAKIYCELQQGALINQLRNIWYHILDCLKRSQPPILFDSAFLEIQASLLRTTLDHPHQPIADVTIEFWKTTYGRKVNLRCPSCLLPTLEKLSRNGRIILQKDSDANDAFSYKQQRGLSRKHAVPNAQKRPLSVNAMETRNDHGYVNLFKGFKRKRLKRENGVIKAKEHVERFEHISGSDCRMDTRFPSDNLSERKEPRKPQHILEMLRRKI